MISGKTDAGNRLSAYIDMCPKVFSKLTDKLCEGGNNVRFKTEAELLNEGWRLHSIDLEKGGALFNREWAGQHIDRWSVERVGKKPCAAVTVKKRNELFAYSKFVKLTRAEAEDFENVIPFQLYRLGV